MKALKILTGLMVIATSIHAFAGTGEIGSGSVNGSISLSEEKINITNLHSPKVLGTIVRTTDKITIKDIRSNMFHGVQYYSVEIPHQDVQEFAANLCAQLGETATLIEKAPGPIDSEVVPVFDSKMNVKVFDTYYATTDLRIFPIGTISCTNSQGSSSTSASFDIK